MCRFYILPRPCHYTLIYITVISNILQIVKHSILIKMNKQIAKFVASREMMDVNANHLFYNYSSPGSPTVLDFKSKNENICVGGGGGGGGGGVRSTDYKKIHVSLK